MKLPIIAVVAFFSAGANAQCDFCPGGFTVESSADVPNTGGETCASLAESAPTLDADEYFCTDVTKLAESVCCPATPDDGGDEGGEDGGGEDPPASEVPSDVTPCPICSDGLTVDEGFTIPYPEANGASCGQLLGYAAITDESSADCTQMKNAEAICCPAAPSDPCSICSGGLTVDENLEIDNDGTTCGSLVANAKNFDESSDECSRMKGEEAICCPAAPENPCSVCSEGVTVDGSVVAPDGRDCDEVVADAKNLDESSETCLSLKLSEAICCPAPMEDSCSVCSEGLTVDESVDLGRGNTCGGLMTDALTVEETSEECSQMKGAEITCCPAAAVDPCSVCSEGLTVDESVDLGGGRTCGGMMTDALNIEEDSDVCSQMKESEPTCCPADELVEDPCSVCSEGITVDESVVISDGLTCGGLMTDALTTEESSEECSQMKEAEPTCCATGELVDEPCSVCSEGITVDGSVVIADGFTCGGLASDALTVEENSDECTAMKGAESTCCSPGLSSVPTATPQTNSSQTSSPQTGSPQTSAPQTSSPLASASVAPTPGKSISTSAPIIAIYKSSAPTAASAPNATLVAGAPTPAVVPTTSSPVATTKTSSPTPSPVSDIVMFESSSMPTPSPNAKETESPNASEQIGTPAFQEPAAPQPPNGSTILVASGFLTFVLTSIVSTVYSMALV
eukprot:CAMPEP_0172307066 /NCGR_PEP_ID=MMETSP1058-20130122/7992_1 /TAXON_ID=83371 /ORGANISM="Detonula confervacea, Strain CCMP 353" /LENGTH=683 /DNA_ID=CAMNT_0013019137 /DNA_START=118 /DNA_END=2169 /DNA_ORIENTATION=+